MTLLRNDDYMRIKKFFEMFKELERHNGLLSQKIIATAYDYANAIGCDKETTEIFVEPVKYNMEYFEIADIKKAAEKVLLAHDILDGKIIYFAEMEYELSHERGFIIRDLFRKTF